MVNTSTVCPLDLSSVHQLDLIACEAEHLTPDYTDDVLRRRLAALRDAALALKAHWIQRTLLATTARNEAACAIVATETSKPKTKRKVSKGTPS